MVATTFSSDTPNLVANFVRTQGVAGNWQWWAFTLTGVATVFFFARLWRRSGVLTDLEFYELRYSGKAASAVRGFRAVYLGLLFNCMIMATVNLAACKIAAVLFGFERWQTLPRSGLLNVVFAAHSGLWGVLVIDMIQFFIKMSAVIAAAYFAVTLPQVGGTAAASWPSSRSMHGPGGLNYLNMLPDFTNNWDLAVAVFIIPITVQWWAVWYPGAEPGGGSYIAQRMLASKSEKDALGGTLFFNVAHYVLRPVAVDPGGPGVADRVPAVIRHPDGVSAPRPHLIGHDIAFPAMLRFLPAGWVGLMLGGLVAANSSTILTHLNWGASYLVHDFYRRFIRPKRDRKPLRAGRALRHRSAVRRFVRAGLRCSIRRRTASISSCRWAPARGCSTWCAGSGGGSRRGARSWPWSPRFWLPRSSWRQAQRRWPSARAQQLIIGIAVTTVCWLIMAYLGPQTDQAVLVDVLSQGRPFGPGWESIRIEGRQCRRGRTAERRELPPALCSGGCTGCIMIWSALFTVGNFLYGRNGYAFALLAVFAVSAGILIR